MGYCIQNHINDSRCNLSEKCNWVFTKHTRNYCSKASQIFFIIETEISCISNSAYPKLDYQPKHCILISKMYSWRLLLEYISYVIIRIMQDLIKTWYHLSDLFAVNSVHLSMMLQFSNTWSLTIKNVNCSRLDRGTPWQAMAQLFQEIRNIFKSLTEKLWSTAKTVSTFAYFWHIL